MKRNIKKYNKNFYKKREDKPASAETIVSLLLEYIKQPNSVVDVGCGNGSWLLTFKKFGVKEILGVEGDWVDKDSLLISEDNFLLHDLEKPLNLEKKFNLAISLEVGEHLSEDSAKIFVKSLTNLAPIILFSAAIPFQGGVNHLNEQWPDYWVKLFRNNNFIPLDFIRGKIWDNDEIPFWYRQNIMVFANKNYIKENNKLRKEAEKTKDKPLSIVHPDKYTPIARRYEKFKNIIPKFVLNLLNKFFKE